MHSHYNQCMECLHFSHLIQCWHYFCSSDCFYFHQKIFLGQKNSSSNEKLTIRKYENNREGNVGHTVYACVPGRGMYCSIPYHPSNRTPANTVSFNGIIIFLLRNNFASFLDHSHIFTPFFNHRPVFTSMGFTQLRTSLTLSSSEIS